MNQLQALVQLLFNVSDGLFVIQSSINHATKKLDGVCMD